MSHVELRSGMIIMIFTKSELGRPIPFLTYKVIADTLHHAVTLTFDLFTLNASNLSAVK